MFTLKMEGGRMRAMVEGVMRKGKRRRETDRENIATGSRLRMIECISLKGWTGERKGIACPVHRSVHTLRGIDLGQCKPHKWE